jgi:transposase
MSDEKKYREYTKEFKLETLELLKKGDKSAARIERELGITDGMLLKWRDRYQRVDQEGQASRLVPSDLEAAKAEIRRLERELADVQEEREILKKVVSIYSRKNG